MLAKYILTAFLRNGGGEREITGAHIDQEAVAQPPAGGRWEIERMIITVRGSPGMDPGDFGSRPELTNGIQLQVRDSDTQQVILDLTDGLPITRNSHWLRLTDRVWLHNYGNGAEKVSVRLVFPRPITLRDHEQLVAVLNDDLGSTVVTFRIEGQRTS